MLMSINKDKFTDSYSLHTSLFLNAVVYVFQLNFDSRSKA
jgi:hypothetical protein